MVSITSRRIVIRSGGSIRIRQRLVPYTKLGNQGVGIARNIGDSPLPQAVNKDRAFEDWRNYVSSHSITTDRATPRQGTPFSAPLSLPRQHNTHSQRVHNTRGGGLQNIPVKRTSTHGAPPGKKGAPTEVFTGIILTLHSNRYVIWASLGISTKTMHSLHEVLDTGSGYNVVRKQAQPPG